MQKTLMISTVLALSLTACSGGGEKTIRIGFVGPLTGDAASYGVDTLNGARIAVDEINAAGGVNGKNIELIAEDGRCNGADAASAAQKLINVDKVLVIIGGQCSSETLAIAPIAEAANVVVVSPLSSSPDITKAGDYIFRVTPSDALKGRSLASYIEKLGHTKVAIISENTDFCQGFRQAVKTSVAPGTVVAFDEVVDPGTKDYRTLLTRLKSVDFDVLFANGQSDATVAEMAKQMRELGMTQQIVGGDGADSNTLGQIAKEAVEGMKVLSMPTLDESVPAAKKYGDIFRQRYDEPKQSLYWSSLAYEAVKVVADGLQSENGGSLKDWLYQMPERAGLAGTFHFDDNGDVVGMPFGIKEFRSGKLVQSDIVMP